MIQVTPLQLETLRFVAEYIKLKERPPTSREVSLYFGISVKWGYDKLVALARLGLIDRQPGTPRGIRITDAGRALLQPAEAYAVIGGRRWLYQRVAVSV